MSVKNPCCCWSLRTGSTVVAVLDIIGGIIILCFGVLALSAVNAIATNVTDVNIQNVKTILYGISIVMIICGVVSVILGCILLHGIQKKSAQHLLVWMIFRLLIFLMSVVVNSVDISLEFSPEKLVRNAISYAIVIWILSVVYYHRKEILAMGNENTITNAGKVHVAPHNYPA